jgi:hypothetical protein
VYAELSETPFSKRVIQLQAGIIESAFGPIEEAPYYGPTRPLSPAEAYVYLCVGTLGRLLSIVEQLDIAARMVGRTIGEITIDGEQIPRMSALAFRIENYLFRMTALFDRAMILTNDVLCLQIDHRNCTLRELLKQEVLSSGPLRDELCALSEVVEPYRDARNRIHRGPYTDDDAFDLARTLETMARAERILGLKPSTESERVRSRPALVGMTVSDKRKEYRKTNEAVLERLKALFAQLQPSFETVYEYVASAT